VSRRHTTTNRASVYADLAEALGSGRSFEELAPQFAFCALRAVSAADGASVTRRQDDTITYIATVQLKGLEGRRVKLENSFTGRVIDARQAAIFVPSNNHAAASSGRASLDGIKSGIVAPIVSGGEVVGTVGVVSFKRADAFDDRALREMQNLADYIGSGLG